VSARAAGDSNGEAGDGGSLGGLVEAHKAYSLAAIPPQPFDKYTLIGKLGHGGMAEVNLAVSEGKGGFRKLVVIKRLHRHLAMEPGFIDMFLDEARLAARLNHPHCVQTYEVGEDDGNHFLAMEYLDGQGLERLLRISGQQRKPMPIALSARIVSDALDGLAYAHELTDFDGTALGVVHRDVSPQNIFITYNGMVKLLDFGIAKAATHVVETKTGVIKGKYAYIAPEQALGQAVDQRSDLWSMGVVLWEVLTGRRLFKSVNELATLHETLQGEIKLPSAFRPDLPTELDTICMRALQRDPDERYQSAQEMKDELERYLRTLDDAPGRKQIAKLMNKRFGDVISHHKQTLAQCLKGSGAMGTETIQRLIPPSTSSQETPTPSVSGVVAQGHGTPTPTPAPVLDSTSVTPPPFAANPGMTGPHAPAPAPERKGAMFWKIAILVAVVLLALVLGLMIPIGLSNDDDDDGRRASADRDPGPAEVLDEPGGTERTEIEPTVIEPELDEGGEATGEGGDEPTPDDGAEAPVAEEPEPEPEPEPSVSQREREARLAEMRRERREQQRREQQRREREEQQRREQQREQQQQAEREAAERTAQRESGFLTLATTPWTHVTLGGRRLGTTPLIRVELPAGTHVLRLRNPDRGIDQTYRVTIQAGETTSRRVGL